MAEESLEFDYGRTTVDLSADLAPAPATDWATMTSGVIAGKGGGKTYLALRMAEDIILSGIPFVAFDPVGNWGVSLRLAADGVSPGLPVVVLGGDEGDVPLAAEDGARLGQLLAEEDGYVVLDVSSFSKSKRKQFVADFCESFFLWCKRRKQPRLVVFEEAQMFAPQMHKGEERMLGAVTELVRIGRNHGIGVVLVSQRPASINKEVLNMVEALFVGQLRGAHERKAIAAWVTMLGEDLGAQLSELPHLETGEFFLWSPSWLRVFKKIHVRKRRTFDGTATPKFGAPGKRRSLDPLEQSQFLLALRKTLGGGSIEGEPLPKKSEAEERQARCEAQALYAPDLAARIVELETGKTETTATWSREDLDRVQSTAESLSGFFTPVEEATREESMDRSEYEEAKERMLATERSLDALEKEMEGLRRDRNERETTIQLLRDELGRVRRAYEQVSARVTAVEQHWARISGGVFQQELDKQLQTLFGIYALPPWLPPEYVPMDPSVSVSGSGERRSEPPPAVRRVKTYPLVSPAIDRSPREEPFSSSSNSSAPRVVKEPSGDYRDVLTATLSAYGPLSRLELQMLSGKSKASSAFNETIAGLIRDEVFFVAEDKRLYLKRRVSAKPPFQKGRELFDYWQGKLDGYDALLFRTLFALKNGLSRSELADRAGRSIKSSAFNESIARLKSKGFVEFAEKKIRVTDFLREVMTS